MSKPDFTTMTRAQVDRYLTEQSRLASACVTMVTVFVTMGGHTFAVYAMPWECLKVARDLLLGGATSFALSHANVASRDAWYFYPSASERAALLRAARREEAKNKRAGAAAVDAAEARSYARGGDLS
jgi:hypothetical protein